jgi:hypothetical protein
MDDKGSIWARTSTQQQCGIFAGIFVAAIVMLLWVTK